MAVLYGAVVECDRCCELFKPTKDALGVRKLLQAAKLAGWHRNTRSVYTDVCKGCVIKYYPRLVSDCSEKDKQ
jgi:hypothetical protein